MFSLFKKNKDNPEVPEWASFFKASEYSDFLKAIDNYFTKNKIAYELHDGMVSTGANDFGFTTLGLTNVAQVCKKEKPRNYHHIVSEHFDSMVRANRFEAEFNKIVHDFEKIEKYRKPSQLYQFALFYQYTWGSSRGVYYGFCLDSGDGF